VVIHDDIELPPGVVKFKRGGSHKGHNGLKSINDSLRLNEYGRIRVGVGRPQSKDRSNVADFVLGPIPGDMLQSCSWDEEKGRGGSIVEQAWKYIEEVAKELAAAREEEERRKAARREGLQTEEW
jgi:peptidyl-tRNA hydrolase